jgi:TIR domain/Interferon-induced transmembrane protein
VQIFVSYARSDRPKVDPLAQRLRQAANDVWLDTDLTGGQVWWDKILHQILQCDAVVLVVSRASLKSQACTVERQYALRLGKPVLPLTIEPLRAGTLPGDIARLEVIDYSQPGEAAAFKLIGAIMRLPPPLPLPNPLPVPPEAPSSYWDTIADQLSAPVLTLDQQLAIVGRLEGAFAPAADADDRPTAFELLSRIESRTDLYAAADRRIAALRNSTKTAAAPSAPPTTASEPPRRNDHPTNSTGETGPMPPHQSQAWQQPPPAWQQPPPTSQQQQPPAWQQPPPTSQQQSPPPPPAWQRQAPSPAAISPHWVLAIIALVCFWPTGIAACVFAARVKPSLGVGDLASAQKSSSRVLIIFWVNIALLVVIIIAAAASSPSNSQGAMATVGHILG